MWGGGGYDLTDVTMNIFRDLMNALQLHYLYFGTSVIVQLTKLQ